MALDPSTEIGPLDAAGLTDALLLDVREPVEWAAGHARAAVHVPMGELHVDHPVLADTDRLVVCVCRSGARSRRVTDALLGAGFRAVNLAGGMQAWAAAGLPVVADDGGSGVVA